MLYTGLGDSRTGWTLLDPVKALMVEPLFGGTEAGTRGEDIFTLRLGPRSSCTANKAIFEFLKSLQ